MWIRKFWSKYTILFLIHTSSMLFYVGGLQFWNLTHLNKLQVLQNRAIRNISKAPRFFRLDNIYLNYRILKVKDLYNLEVCKFMHKHHNKSLPNCLNSFFSISQQRATHSSSNLNYNTPFYRSNKGQRSIKFYGPKIWNSIPLSVRNLSFIDIKKQYKNLILSKYWLWIHTSNVILLSFIFISTAKIHCNYVL